MKNENIFKDKTILITGCGTVGRELARQLKEYKPYSIRLFDNSEHALWEGQMELGNNAPFRYLLGDVTNYDRVEMALWEVDYVFHTSAQKFVEFGEYNPMHSINVNIIGSQNIIKTCLKNPRIKKICNISTDKVVNSSNLYGKTKAISEYLFNWASKISTSKQIFYNVRLCNIMGSRGSVLPKWEKQIKEGYITATDMNMKRYMIDNDFACNFIIQTMEIADKYCIYIPKHMNCYSIRELAEEFVKSKGYERLEDVEIKIIGKYQGEKIDENLWSKEEEEFLSEGHQYWLINKKIL